MEEMLFKRIDDLPKELQRKIGNLIKHPIVEKITENNELYLKYQERKVLYDYMYYKMNFFKEELLWETTDEYFNQITCDIIRKIMIKDKTYFKKKNNYDRQKTIKKAVFKLNKIAKNNLKFSSA